MTGEPAAGAGRARTDSGDAVRAEAVDAEAVGPDPARADAVRAEAGRLAHRLRAAGRRLDSALEPPPGRGSDWAVAPDPAAPRRRIDEVDDEIRDLLAPTARRVAHLTDLAAALADGTLSEDEAREAARRLAEDQPGRGPR